RGQVSGGSGPFGEWVAGVQAAAGASGAGVGHGVRQQFVESLGGEGGGRVGGELLEAEQVGSGGADQFHDGVRVRSAQAQVEGEHPQPRPGGGGVGRGVGQGARHQEGGEDGGEGHGGGHRLPAPGQQGGDQGQDHRDRRVGGEGHGRGQRESPVQAEAAQQRPQCP